MITGGVRDFTVTTGGAFGLTLASNINYYYEFSTGRMFQPSHLGEKLVTIYESRTSDSSNVSKMCLFLWRRVPQF